MLIITLTTLKRHRDSVRFHVRKHGIACGGTLETDTAAVMRLPTKLLKSSVAKRRTHHGCRIILSHWNIHRRTT